MTRIGLVNRSSKEITAVRFKWYVYRKESPKRILKEGETPEIGVGQFAAGTEREVEYPIVYFGRILQSLADKGRLSGEFVGGTGGGAIRYADGSAWKRG